MKVLYDLNEFTEEYALCEECFNVSDWGNTRRSTSCDENGFTTDCNHLCEHCGSMELRTVYYSSKYKAFFDEKLEQIFEE